MTTKPTRTISKVEVGDFYAFDIVLTNGSVFRSSYRSYKGFCEALSYVAPTDWDAPDHFVIVSIDLPDFYHQRRQRINIDHIVMVTPVVPYWKDEDIEDKSDALAFDDTYQKLLKERT